jgi:hypothetical protein
LIPNGQRYLPSGRLTRKLVNTQGGAWLQEAAMRRRNLVVWSQSADSADRRDLPRPTRARRLRRRTRIVFLFTIVALWPALRAVRARWRPLLAGSVLTVTGFILRTNPIGSVLLLPGLTLLFMAPLLPGAPEGDRLRRLELERELAVYSTARQRFDLEATLDQYPDGVTHELRDILARQAFAAGNGRYPGAGR